MTIESKIDDLTTAIKELTAAIAGAGGAKPAATAPAPKAPAPAPKAEKAAPKPKPQKAPAKEPEKNDEGSPAYSDVVAALTALASAKGRSAAIELLASDPFAVSSAKQLTEEQWPDFIEACNAAAAEGDDA